MKIAAYCRVSTEKEAQIDSLEKQIEFFNEFTKKNGYELYKLYADEGISGKQIKHRKQFQAMMQDAKAHKFERVVVKDVSRFARNTVDLLQSIRELKSYGIQVDFLNNGEVMEGGSEFILTILGAMAQQESANMSKRVKFGKDITAKKGRVPNLVFGYDKIPDEKSMMTLEGDLHFCGLVGMIDPPRPEAKAAVARCRKAGIKPVMITGDHVVTASAIARELGIMREGDRALTGAQVDAMTDSELDEHVESIAVYARVSPENKIRIVKSWQRKGQVVAMTGDGVNDAPALKAADIGCAMGITGTDVAKGAADMTLTDDNFATIVDAVREGRGIYANIKKVVGYLLGTNIGEVITVFTAMMLWHKTPLLSMQLLWINLVTDSLPAIALGMEAVESEVMTQKPKPKSEGLFAHGFGVRIVLQGVMFGLLALFAFMIGEKSTGTVAGGQTMAFAVLALSQVIQAYNMRSEHSLFKIGMFTNKKLNQAALLSIVLVLAVLFTPLRIPFGLELLSLNMYLTALGMVLIPILVMEFSKAFGLIRHQH